ncbi:unnamed protein product [Lathyrus sativus]|nr:unnamed protein product [Lathyrus sativus]
MTGRGKGRGQGRPPKNTVPPPSTTPPVSPAQQQLELRNHLASNTSLTEEGILEVETLDARTRKPNQEEMETATQSMDAIQAVIPKQPENGKPIHEGASEEGRKLWVDVLKDNRNPTKGRAMKFIAPQVVNGKLEVVIENEDIISEVKFWESSLILYTMGVDLSMNAVKNFMTRNWNFVQLPDMYYNDEGYFILRFKSFKDRDEVLLRGPYMIRNIPLLIREWRPGFKFKDEILRTLPIWVKLPQLPIILWGDTSLNKIGSALGNPIMTDECTANRLRVSYARILVEMDIRKELPQIITIGDNEGEKIQQPIEYEWRPLFCSKCQKVGHSCDKPKVTQQWKPKPAPQHVDNVKTVMDNTTKRIPRTEGNNNIVGDKVNSPAVENNAKGNTLGECPTDLVSKAADPPLENGVNIIEQVEAVMEKWIEVIRSGKDRGKP